MGLKDLFGKWFKNSEKEPEPVIDRDLAELRVGDLVDFEDKTWQVEGRHAYDWGEGDPTREWQLKAHDDVIYLELDVDDEEVWTICRPISINQIPADVFKHIREHQDPPEEIVFQETRYQMISFGGGYFLRNEQPPGEEMLSWEYADETEEKYLFIEQWDENEFEASVGQPVERYQFINIIPAG